MRKSFWKKAAALLMTGALVMGTVPVSVFAEGPDEEAPEVIEIRKDDLDLENTDANSKMDPEKGNDGPAEWAFDGDNSHWWHSNWSDESTDDNVEGQVSETNPVWIQTGLKESRKVAGLIYQGRSTPQQIIKDFEIWVSNEDTAPDIKTEASAAEMTKVDTDITTFAESAGAQTVRFAGTDAKWIRLVAKSAYTFNDENYVAAVNIKILAEPKEGESLKSLEITEPTKKEYTIGEEFDATGLKVVGVYDNDEQTGSKETVDLTKKVTISGFDKYKIDDAQEITVAYGELSGTFTVAVKAVSSEEEEISQDILRSHAYADSVSGSDDATKAFDGNAGDHWHSNAITTTPASIRTGFGEVRKVKRLEYIPRTVGMEGGKNDQGEDYVMNGVIRQYKLQVTKQLNEDGTVKDDDALNALEENDDAAVGWKTVASGKFDLKREMQAIELEEAVEATHVRLVAVTASNWAPGSEESSDSVEGFATASSIRIFAMPKKTPAETVVGLTAVPGVTETEIGKPAPTVEVTVIYGDGNKEKLEGEKLQKVTYSPELSSITESIGNKTVTVTYQPAEGEVYTTTFTIKVMDGPAPEKVELAKIDKTVLKANADANSSNDSGHATDGGPEWAFDNEEHWWHSDYSSADADKGLVSEENPIWIQTGFNETRKVYGMLYMPRTGNGQNVTKDYEVWVSNSDTKPDIATPASEIEGMTKVAEGSLQAIDTIAQTIMLNEATDAQWIRFVTKSVGVVPGSRFDGNGNPDQHVTAKFIDVLAAPKEDGTEETLENITVNEGYKAEYVQGESFDRANTSVTAHYTGTDPIQEALVSGKDLVVRGFESAEIGEKAVELYFMGNKADITVDVVEPDTLTGIEVTTPPTKTTYTIGDDTELNTAGMVVTATYNDDPAKTKTIPNTSIDIDETSYDLTEAGTYQVKVSYTEEYEDGRDAVTVEATFDITVEEKVIPQNPPTIQLDKSEITLSRKAITLIDGYPIGSTDSLTATVEGEGELTDWAWTSSDPSVKVTADESDPKRAAVESASVERQPKDVEVTVSAKFGEETVSAKCTVKVDNWYADVPHDYWGTGSGQDKLEAALKSISDGGWVEGYTKEYEDKKARFGPNDSLLRYQFALIVYRMAGKPEIDADKENPFTDVTEKSVPSAEARTAILWANEAGVIKGYNATTFGPNDTITRAQMMTMMYRYADQVEKVAMQDSDYSDLTQFGDEVKEIQNEEMKKAISWCVGKEVVGGVTVNGETKLAPQGTAPRAQCAIVVSGFANIFQEAE